MKRKIFGLALATTLALAACSNEEDINNDTDEAGTAAEPVEDSQSEDQTDDATSEGSSNEDNSSSESEEGTEENEGTSSVSGETIALDDVNLSPEDAIEIAQGEFDGDLHEIQLDQNRGEWVYKIEIESASEEAEVKINQETEEVVDVETESNDDHNGEEILDYSSVKPVEEAYDAASSDLGGGDILEWSLAMDDGRAEYDIDLLYENSKYEYTLDADSLEVLEAEHDED